MKKSTAMKLNMYLNVHSVLDKHQTAWESVPAFAGSVANFNSKLDLLQIRLVEQDSATHGVAAKKEYRLSDLRERMLTVHKALSLLGKAIGNWALEERNKTNKTALERLNINKLTIHCDELKLDLNAFSPQLSAYGITSEMIDQLIPMLDSIDEWNISTRQAIMDRKSITTSIKNVEQSLDALLHDEMDSILLAFKINQPEFFAAFRNARKVIKYGSKGKPGGAPEPDDGSGV